MKAQIGQVLRMVGILIEVACVILHFAPWSRGRSVVGLPVHYLSYVGIAFGIAVWAVGMVLVRTSASTRRPRP